MSSQLRGFPSNEPPGPRSRRPAGDPRDDGGAAVAEGTMSRAEMFQDEKRRILSSCFAKMDSDGVLAESYITHIRIAEDAAYPSSPPPPSSSPENKKPRIIIVSLRKSGRVRIHKARENNDGTFSIGKTWMLDDLNSIQSYSNPAGTTQLEQQHKQWAGNVGFVVTVGKPYYWQAANFKERDFFIASLVKIYKKYTGGRVPRLIGFDERQKQALLGDSNQGSLRSEASLNPTGSQPSQIAQGNRAPSREGRNGLTPRLPDEQYLRAQRSRDQVPRPLPSPARPAEQIPNLRDDVPTKLKGQPENDRIASPPKPPFASKSESPGRSSPESTRAISRGREGSPANVRQVGRPPQSRDGGEIPEYRAYQTLDVHRGQQRPATSGSVASSHGPSSSLDQRSLLPENNDKSSRPSSRHEGSLGSAPPSRGSDRSRPSSRNELDVPPALRPGSSGSTSSRPAAEPIKAASEPARPLPEPIPTPSMTIDEVTVPLQSAISAPAPESLEPTETVQPPGPASPPERPATEPVGEQGSPDEHRPGLGPMIKKKQAKDIAGAFRKAATAYGAFRPRPGGAGERLMAKQKPQSQEPDGITSVVPAPLLRGQSNESTKTASTPTTVTSQAAPSTSSSIQEPPKVEITQAATEDTPLTIETQTKENLVISVPEIAEPKVKPRSPSPSQERRRKRREDHTAQYCHALGIDPSLLDGRGLDFDELLTDLGWSGRLNDDKKIEDLEADIRREIGRVQATSWLGNIEQQEGKIDQLAKLIDKTIEECEEVDGLLTLYSHELSTLHDDVAYIEAQSQGLQVQTANQKLLQNELQNLLTTLSISSNDLQPLREASLDNTKGLQVAETVLCTLYKAMLTIDSDIRQNRKRMADAAGDHSSVGVYADTEVGQMRAIREKKDEYRIEASAFLKRLRQFMSIAFKRAEQKRLNAVTDSKKDPLKLETSGRDLARQELWMYHALMLFAREVSSTEWVMIINLYEQDAKSAYQGEIRENCAAWKKAAKKVIGDEHELLFTHHEKDKESEGITNAARKLTVRRGKTVRLNQGLRGSHSEKQTGRLELFEAFTGALQESLKLISQEQNFAVHFFHLNSLASGEFPDLVAISDPASRHHPDFNVKQMHDPDRDLARRVEEIMDGIYSFWTVDMQNLVDWVIKSDQLQGVGVLAAIEAAISEFDDTNQDFLVHSLQKLHTRLNALFHRFVDEQIRGIEETKVKVNKRKGVISFMRIFPNFSAAIENMLTAQSSSDFSDIRVNVNDAYTKINRAMWESLKFIAKEAPGQIPGATSGVGDPEDKEALNYHILLIENMNHYIEEVDVRGLPVLERWRDRAFQDYHEHMKLYLDAVIRRPLGKLLDFIESTESLLTNTSNPSDIASRASHSRHVAKKLLSSIDSKELRRGADLLKKRIEKHFGDADDPGLSRSLVTKVYKECETRYGDAYDRTKKIIDAVYDGQIDLDWTRDEATALFRRN